MSGISKLLLEIYDPPPILSYKGNIELLNHNKCVAIVGAKNALQTEEALLITLQMI
nr:DNA-processing protein DprA [Rickettsia amblyommatis]